MEITRRKFFFFGLAAGVGLFVPSTGIKINDDELYLYHNGCKTLEEVQKLNPNLSPFYLGIPYHENNASIGTWLGLSRT